MTHRAGFALLVVTVIASLGALSLTTRRDVPDAPTVHGRDGLTVVTLKATDEHGHGALVFDGEAIPPVIHITPGGTLAIHDVFEDPSAGGQAPFHVWRRAVAEAFEPVSTTGSLRVLRNGTSVLGSR